MMLKLKYPVLLLILSFLFGACQKEYSLDGNVAGAAGTFIYPGAPGPCASAVVTGTYTGGIALGVTNIVTISVDVTTTGTYTISTPAVNGISFSGSGSFTTTGIQTISLAGTGIPTTAGIFSFTTGTDGCSFPVTVSAPGGGATAVFTYTGAPGACTSATLAGTYIAGTALTALNNVAIEVNVTAAGTWSVSTPAVNGFSFAGSGSFTSAGVQQVTLTGSGTPTADGSFEFTPPNNGCSFTVPVLAASGSSTGFYYEATIDGVAYKETVTETNGYEAGSALGGIDDVVLGSSISPSTEPIPANQTELSIGKGLLHNYLAVSNATFKSFFTPGSYPYAASSYVDGVSVSWIDRSGNFWSTDNAPGTQTGSVFTIISVEDAPSFNGYYIKVTATFNCTLYDLHGIAKPLTGGKYVGLFGKI